MPMEIFSNLRTALLWVVADHSVMSLAGLISQTIKGHIGVPCFILFCFVSLLQMRQKDPLKGTTAADD